MHFRSFKPVLRILIFVVPGVLLILFYIISDPFKVLGDYDSWYDDGIDPNRDFVSTEIFLKNYKRLHYDSFILGSSRTAGLRVENWANYIGDDAIPYKFDASGEGVYGIYTKIKFLDSLNVDMKYMLILFCREGTVRIENDKGHLFIKHPSVSQESWFNFHKTFFVSFINFRFLAGYLSNLILKSDNIFTEGIITTGGRKHNQISNDLSLSDWDSLIDQDPNKYYGSRKSLFYDRNTETFDSEDKIGLKQQKMFKEIKEILERNNTDYKFVLSPVYDMKKLSHNDKNFLTKLYGERLYDFTGKNFITTNIRNWYELHHFRPFVGDSIMSIIYDKK